MSLQYSICVFTVVTLTASHSVKMIAIISTSLAYHLMINASVISENNLFLNLTSMIKTFNEEIVYNDIISDNAVIDTHCN